MTDKIHYPRDVRIPIRFFGRFTVHDIIRLAAPGAGVFAWTQVAAPPTNIAGAAAAAALVLGIIWMRIRPYGLPAEQLLYHVVRWAAGRTMPAITVDKIEDRVATTSAGTVVGAVRVTPVNLEMKDSSQRAALHGVYQDLLSQATYPVEIQSRQLPVSMNSYIDRVGETAEDDGVAAAYHARLQEYVHTDAVTSHHYLIVRATGTDAPTAIDQRCNEIIDTITGAGLSGDRVTGMELQSLMKSFDPADITAGCARYDTGEGGGSSRYRRMAAITEYPDTLPLGWPVKFLQLDGRVDVVQLVRPRDQSETADALRTRLQRLEAERGALLNEGHLGTNNIETAIEDVDWMLDTLSDRSDQVVDHAAYLIAHGPTEDACDDTFRRMTQRLKQYNIDYIEPWFRTDQAIKASSAVTGGGLDTALPMPASSAAGGFPFATRNRQENSGVLFGTDDGDGTPVLEDRFAWNAGHIARMGMIGSGKSYGAKLALLRAYAAYEDLEIRIIDPKQEYGVVGRVLDGSRITVDEKDLDAVTPSHDVTRYTVSDRSELHVSDLVDAVKHIYQHVADSETRTVVVIDEAHRLLNDEDGKAELSRFVRESRDTDTAITMISQNAADFTYSRAGRAILDNVPCKVFMRHERVPESVQDYFQLSDQETQELLRLKTGTEHDYAEAVMKVSDRLDAKLRIDASAAEAQIIEEGEAPDPGIVEPRHPDSDRSDRGGHSSEPDAAAGLAEQAWSHITGATDALRPRIRGIREVIDTDAFDSLITEHRSSSPFTSAQRHMTAKLPQPDYGWETTDVAPSDGPPWVNHAVERSYTLPDGGTYRYQVGKLDEDADIELDELDTDPDEGGRVYRNYGGQVIQIWFDEDGDIDQAVNLIRKAPGWFNNLLTVQNNTLYWTADEQ
jgi:hypothetical protein